MLVKLRYKAPDGDTSKLIKLGVVDKGRELRHGLRRLQVRRAVAGFGMLLRESPHKGSLTYDAVLELASSAASRDPQGYRREFLTLVQKGADAQQVSDLPEEVVVRPQRRKSRIVRPCPRDHRGLESCGASRHAGAA